MRTTDFCFPLPEYEHPRLVSYRHLFEAYASPLAIGLAPVARGPVNLAFHDAKFASVGFFGLARGIRSSGRSQSSRTSDTPVASRLLPRAFARGGLPKRQDRFFRPSVKMRRSLRPEVPSIGGGHSRTCVNRCRARDRGHVCFRDDPALAAASRVGPRARFRFARGFHTLDPRPRPLCVRDVHANDQQALLWVRQTPNDFCNCTSDARTHSRAPDSRRLDAPAVAVTPNVLSLSPRFFTAWRPSPVEEGSRTLRAVTTPSKPTPLRCKHAVRRDSECHHPIVTPLAGNASIRPPFAAMAVG